MTRPCPLVCFIVISSTCLNFVGPWWYFRSPGRTSLGLGGEGKTPNHSSSRRILNCFLKAGYSGHRGLVTALGIEGAGGRQGPYHLDPASTATFLNLGRIGRSGLNHPHTSKMTERKLYVPPYQLYPLILNALPFNDLEREFGGRRRTVSSPVKAKVTAVQAHGKVCGRILRFNHLDTTFHVQVPISTLVAQTAECCSIH